MSMNRYEIRNEYSLADPELYRAADKDDPEALLEGVAMAGLVGVLRQLGDLAEFAAEIFHDLHEEVMATAARGHGLMIRVQQLEAEIPFIEKTFLSQTDHSSSFYNSGVDWRSNIRISQNLVTQGDLPRFIMDSYEECRGPPRLFLLDKFDVGGAGACLKRYTDPSFFKVETSGVTGADVHREKKIRKAKKKGPRWRNGETPEVLPASHAKLNQLFLDEHVENRAKNPAHRAKLKRKLNGFPFDSKTGKSYMEKLLTPPDHKMIDEVVSSSSLMLPLNDLSDSGVDIPEVGPLSHYHERVVEKSIPPSAEREDLRVNSSTSESNEISTDDNMWEAPNSCNNIVINGISPTFDKEVTDEEDKPMDGERKTEGSLIGSGSDDISSEIDNYVDAPSSMGSEMDADSELRMKGDFSPYMKSKSSISDANEDHLNNRSSDSQSTGESTMSDEGFNSLKKEISSFSLSESPSTSIESPHPEKRNVEGFPSADIAEVDKVDALHLDEDFGKDQHGRPIFPDDTCRGRDAISYQMFDLHLHNSSVDQIISEPEDVFREGRLKEPKSFETADTLDDNDEGTERVVHPTCSLSDSDSESQSGDNSLRFSAGKHAGDETNGEAYTSNGNEIKTELVIHQTSSPCISDSTSESGDDSPRSSAGGHALEESNSDNIFCTFTLSDTLFHAKDGFTAVSADLLHQDDPDQHGHDSPVSYDGGHPVDKLNSDNTPYASTVSDALHPTKGGLDAVSADLLHEEDVDQHDQHLIENVSSALISCEILSQKESDTPEMISMESPIPGKLEKEIPKMSENVLSDDHIAHNVEDTLSTLSREEKLPNELYHCKISSDASDYSRCILDSIPRKEFAEASFPKKQNLEDADYCSITAAENQMDTINLMSSHIEDSNCWPRKGPYRGDNKIIPEEEATLNVTLATGSSESIEVVGLQEIEITDDVRSDDSVVLEDPLNLEVTARASDIVANYGIPEIPAGIKVTEILGSANLRSENERHVLLDKSGGVLPHEYTADLEHLGTLESLNEGHVILEETDGHILSNESDAVSKNESFADLKCPGDPEETAGSSIMQESDGIPPSGLKVTKTVGFADVKSLNEADVLLDESFSLKEQEDPLSAAADNSDTDCINLPADLDKLVEGHNQCYKDSCLHVLGNDLNCLPGSPRESCLSENFSHSKAAISNPGAAFGTALGTYQSKSEESDAASASCLDPIIEHKLQIGGDATIPTLEQSGFDTEQDSFQENDIANHVSGNDLNCLPGSQRESSLSDNFSHREDATSNPGANFNTPFSTDQLKSEESDAVVTCFDPIIEHSLQVGDATIPSTLEQSGFNTEHDSFHENDTAYHVSGASCLPIDYNTERTIFQDKIEMPLTQPDDEVRLAGVACSQLSTLCPNNSLEMLNPDVNEVDNNSDRMFPHVNNNPSPPSLSVFPGISNYEGNVPRNPMELGSTFPQNSLFSETNHIKLDELPPLPPLPPVQWRMGKFQHVSSTVDREVVKQELLPERISSPTACTIEDSSYLEGTHNSLIQIAPPLASKEEKVEHNLSDSAVNSVHETISLPQDIGDKLQQPTASTDDVGSLLEEVNHSLSQIAPSIALKEEMVVNCSPSIEVDTIRETVKVIPMTENQSLLSLPSNNDVTSLHGENDPSLIKIFNQSSSSLETSTTQKTSDPPLQLVMPSSEAKFASPEDSVQNERGTVKLPRPRNPLIDAVAAIDRSKLRKVTERVRAQVQKVDERDPILEQIRTKSFNLKPTVASRPSFRGSGTNLKLAAILEKANAIRQALAGSDEDDDDSWSDS